ncbi:Heat shock transcription factor, partial [Coemansia erecta]
SQFDHHVLSRQPVASSYPSAASAARKQLPAFRTLAAAADSSGVSSAPAVSDYRTTIHFLTTPSTATESAMDVDASASPDLGSVPVSALLQSDDIIRGSESTASSAQYRDDELTGMAGLMELAGPEHKGYQHGYAPAPMGSQPAALVSGAEAYSSSNSSNSTASYSVPPALNIANRSSPGSYAVPRAHAMPGHQQLCSPPQQQQLYSSPPQHSYHQQQQMYSSPPQQPFYQSHQLPPRLAPHHSAGAVGSPISAGQAMRTPDSLPSSTTALNKATLSFPATVDDLRTARRRSQSTDSMQNNSHYGQGSSALPCVLGNANIRNRAYTQTQRQRTNDTPLFPILLHRIINDPKNESWIRWCDDGKAFKFSSADNLLACLQAAGLRAQNYHSIEKNLNDYRFTRLTDQRRKLPDKNGVLWWMFSHPQFLRSNPEGIVNIQRRRRTNPPAASPQPSNLHSGNLHSANLHSQGPYSLPPSASSARQGQGQGQGQY